MAIDVKAGTFTTNTSTGNQAVTGVGFLPKAILFAGVYHTAHGSTTTMYQCVGCATSSAQRWAATIIGQHGGATRRSAYNNALAHAQYDTAGNLLLAFDFVSFDADGFTVNISTNSGATAAIIYYLALGGAEITNAKAGTMAVTSGTGSESSTDPGFQPNIVLFGGSRIDTTIGTNLSAGFRLGVTDGTAEAAFGTRSSNNSNPSQTGGVLRSDRSMVNTSTVASPAVTGPGFEITSMDATGFTINRTESSGLSHNAGYLALAGTFEWKIGTETQATSISTKQTTGLGFQPKAILFGSAARAVSSSATDETKAVVGFSDGTNNCGVTVHDADNLATASQRTVRAGSNTKCLTFLTQGAGSTTTDAEAGVSSVDSDSFTLDWTTADGTAREFWYLALGETTPAVPDYHYRLAWKATKNAVTAEFPLPLHNPDATAVPTVTDDADALYSPGSLWLYGTTLYVCTNATPGAAVWVAQVPTGTNLLANGSFRVAQRGTGPFTSATTPANNDYAVLIDTWRLLSDGNDAVDVIRVIDANNVYEIGMDVETANKKFGVVSWVENKNTQLGNVSMQVRVRATGGGVGFSAVKAAIIGWSGTADAVGDPISAWNADSVSPTLNANYSYLGATVASTALAHGAEATLTLDNIAVTIGVSNIGVMVWSDDTTTATGDFLYVSKAKLEIGTTTSTFTAGNYQDDLAHCQRYFFALGGSTNRLPATGRADATNVGFYSYPLGHEMRTSPTLSVVGTGNFQLNDGLVQISVSSIGANYSTPQTISPNFLMAASTFTVGRTLFGIFTDATTFIYASAEL